MKKFILALIVAFVLIVSLFAALRDRGGRTESGPSVSEPEPDSGTSEDTEDEPNVENEPADSEEPGDNEEPDGDTESRAESSAASIPPISQNPQAAPAIPPASSAASTASGSGSTSGDTSSVGGNTSSAAPSTPSGATPAPSGGSGSGTKVVDGQTYVYVEGFGWIPYASTGVLDDASDLKGWESR